MKTLTRARKSTRQVSSEKDFEQFDNLKEEDKQKIRDLLSAFKKGELESGKRKKEEEEQGQGASPKKAKKAEEKEEEESYDEDE